MDDLDWDSENNLFLEALNDGVVMAAADGTIIGANTAFCQLFKYSRSDLMGKNVTELMEAKYANNHPSYMSKYIERGYGSFIGNARQYNVKNASGNFVPAEISLGELSKGSERTFVARFRAVGPAQPENSSPSRITTISTRNLANIRAHHSSSDSDSRSQTDDERVDATDPLYSTVAQIVSTALKTPENSLVEAVFTELKTVTALLDAEKVKSAKQACTIKKLKALRQRKLKIKSQAATSSDAFVSTFDAGLILPTSSSSQFAEKNMIVVGTSEPIIGQQLAATGRSGAGVYCANVDGWQCVVKELIIKDLPSQQLKLFEFEMQTLESLPIHRNLARYLFHIKTPTKYQLFMTRYDSTLGDVIRQRRFEQKTFTKREVVQFLLDICRGVEILHKHEIIHRDLKSDNIFVEFGRSGEVMRLVIGDFDTAKRISLHGQPQTVIGTPGFMAPEILLDTRYGYPADVWSIGMVLYELLCLERPFEQNLMQGMDLTLKGTRPVIEAAVIGSSLGALIPIYEKCLAFEPGERPTLSQLNRMLVDLFLMCE